MACEFRNLWFVFIGLLVGCAPSPSELSSMQGSAASANAEQSIAATVDYGGAQIGDDVYKANAQSCIESGKFFDRTAKPKPACTVVQLAKMTCREDAIKQSFSEGRKVQFERLKNSKLSGYLLDQCVDCSVQVSRKTCRENIGRNDILTGTMMTFAREVAGKIDVQVVYIPK